MKSETLCLYYIESLIPNNERVVPLAQFEVEQLELFDKESSF